MKLSEIEGKEVSLKMPDGNEVLAILKEIRPIGIFLEIISSQALDYRSGQHLFVTSTVPIILKVEN